MFGAFIYHISFRQIKAFDTSIVKQFQLETQ